MGTTRNRQGTAITLALRTTRSRLIAIAAVIGVLTTGTILGGPDAAWAKDYPTWSDVANARNNEAATKARVAEIEAALVGLQAEADRTQADSVAKGEIFFIADTKFQAAASRAGNLQSQADAANEVAKASLQRAGQMAAQLVRGGGNDIAANLFANSGQADDLLYGLGMSNKLAEQADAIYERALTDKNTAQALTDQAQVARDELEVLKVAAEKAFAEAQAAAELAATKLQEQQAAQADLQAKLVVLKANRAATEADYLAGVQERINSGASLGAGEISLSGWAKPVSGPITDYFGWRVSPGGGVGSSNHQGMDFGASTGTPIYAASSGTVVYAGWNGGYGNFVMIDHGGGVRTAYGHIVSGGILVSVGQEVGVGTNIAKVGSTGNSTGPHLHFEVRINGTAVDPLPFMANQGIQLG